MLPAAAYDPAPPGAMDMRFGARRVAIDLQRPYPQWAP
jgi:hypothetical protein